MYHSSTKLTPFQGFTGKRPDLSKLHIFGSRVYARKSGNCAAKLDNHAAEGIFLCFSAMDNNLYFIDDATGKIRMGQHVIFDKAHMSVPAGKAPLAAQALQRLGYYVKESWVSDEKTKDQERTLQTSLRICRITPTAKMPTHGSPKSVGYDVYLDLPSITIPPGQMNLLPTGLAAKLPDGSYLRIAPCSGLMVKNSLHTLGGVVDPDYTGNITVVIHNFATAPQTFQHGDKIAQLIVGNAFTPEMVEVTDLHHTTRGASGFGSTDKPGKTQTKPVHPPSCQLAIQDHDLPEHQKPPDKVPFAAAAAAIKMNKNILNDLHLSFQMPYDLNLSNSPLDNQTF